MKLDAKLLRGLYSYESENLKIFNCIFTFYGINVDYVACISNLPEKGTRLFVGKIYFKQYSLL